MAKRARTTKSRERKPNIPGFDAEASLGSTASGYRGEIAATGSTRNIGTVTPQLGLGSASGVDLGAYLRCKANGGGELVCRFFGGLPPFTIGSFSL
jgi:hypothetical protein